MQEVQPDRRETARDGRAGESGRPGTGVQPRTLWIKVPRTWASHAGPGFGREAAVLAVSAERSAAAPSHAPRDSSRIPPAELGVAGFALLQSLKDP